jgi:hypothetical protein
MSGNESFTQVVDTSDQIPYLNAGNINASNISLGSAGSFTVPNATTITINAGASTAAIPYIFDSAFASLPTGVILTFAGPSGLSVQLSPLTVGPVTYVNGINTTTLNYVISNGSSTNQTLTAGTTINYIVFGGGPSY